MFHNLEKIANQEGLNKDAFEIFQKTIWCNYFKIEPNFNCHILIILFGQWCTVFPQFPKKILEGKKKSCSTYHELTGSEIFWHCNCKHSRVSHQKVRLFVSIDPWHIYLQNNLAYRRIVQRINFQMPKLL